MIGALARPPLARLFRTPRYLFVIAAWCLLTVALAVAARFQGSTHGADHVLLEAYGTLILPMLEYTLVGAVLGAGSLGASAAPLAALGAAPGRAALAVVGIAAAACAVLGALLATVVAIVAHSSADPPAVSDAMASAYAGALGGASYAAWFVFGASFGKRGGGRTALLFVDWILGVGHGPIAVVTPRAHLRNLLGGRPPLDWSERWSAVALVLLAVVCAALAVRRVSRS